MKKSPQQHDEHAPVLPVKLQSTNSKVGMEKIQVPADYKVRCVACSKLFHPHERDMHRWVVAYFDPQRTRLYPRVGDPAIANETLNVCGKCSESFQKFWGYLGHLTYAGMHGYRIKEDDLCPKCGADGDWRSETSRHDVYCKHCKQIVFTEKERAV